MRFWKAKRAIRKVGRSGKWLGFEQLEDKRLLAIVWANEFVTSGPDKPEFNTYYQANETIARQIVNRAISDWNKVILDQNWDNDNNPSTNGTFNLKVIAADLDGSRGGTDVTGTSPNVVQITPKVPIAAPIGATNGSERLFV